MQQHSLDFTETERKPPITETQVRETSGFTLRLTQSLRIQGRLIRPELAERIWRRACELQLAGDCREISSVIRAETTLPEAIIDTLLVLVASQFERQLNALVMGIRNAEAISREAATSVWEDAA